MKSAQALRPNGIGHPPSVPYKICSAALDTTSSTVTYIDANSEIVMNTDSVPIQTIM